MLDKDKIRYFNTNNLEIFAHKSNIGISFICDCSNKLKLAKLLRQWPDEIKIIRLDRRTLPRGNDYTHDGYSSPDMFCPSN